MEYVHLLLTVAKKWHLNLLRDITMSARQNLYWKKTLFYIQLNRDMSIKDCLVYSQLRMFWSESLAVLDHVWDTGYGMCDKTTIRVQKCYSNNDKTQIISKVYVHLCLLKL